MASLGGIAATVFAPAYKLLYEPAKKARKAEDAAIEEQRNAQRQAEARAGAQMRQSEMAQRAANRRAPDLASILNGAQGAATTGAGGTLLTGPGGIGRDRLKLGKSSLLGG